jgi:hypothetical protein
MAAALEVIPVMCSRQDEADGSKADPSDRSFGLVSGTTQNPLKKRHNLGGLRKFDEADRRDEEPLPEYARSCRYVSISY